MSTLGIRSPRNKLIGLGITSMLFFWSAYYFSISRTLDAQRQVISNASKIAKIEDAPKLIEKYEKQLAGSLPLSKQPSYSRERLFEKINIFCRGNDLQILHLYPELRVNIQNFELITNQLELQGDFKSMVRLSWYIEQEEHLGNIASATYKTMEDKRTGHIWLTGSFFIQNYFQNGIK